MFDYGGATHWTVSVWTYGRVEIQFQHMSEPPFNSMDKRMELRRRLNAIPGIDIPEEALTRRPSIPVATLTDDAILQQFLSVLDWIIEEAKAGSTAGTSANRH